MHRLISVVLIVGLLSPGCGAMKSADRPSGMRSDLEVAVDDAEAYKGTPQSWKRSTIAANATRLMVGDHEQLAQRAMQTRVTIDGFRARVLIDYVFANDTDRQLEGTFQLRLPEQATPYFFAFGESVYQAPSSKPESSTITGSATDPEQILAERKTEWLAPRVARMVPRTKAAFAYGETVRQRVDPALVEWSGAGVFSARVFPLAPRKLHRLVVGYDVDLVRIGDDLELELDVPRTAGSPTVDVSVADAPGVVVASSPQVTAGAIAGRKQFRFDQLEPGDTVSIRLRGVGSPAIVGADASGQFFAAQAQLSLPAVASPGADTAVFMVDTSLSSNPDRFNVFVKLLRAVLDTNRGSLKRFAVLFFGVDARWYQPGFIDNTPANVDALMTFVNTLALEGATDLGAALTEASHPSWHAPLAAEPDHGPDKPPYDVFLLSDGAATWGEANLHAIARGLASGRAGSLFAYQTGLAGTDTPALSHLARETGGAVFSVTGESEIARAAIAHRSRPWRLVEANVTGASDVLLAGRPSSLFPGQNVLVVGRGAITPGAELALTVERDGQRERVTTRLGVPIKSQLAPRAYGQVATTQLEELEAATEPVAKAFATHFRVTGRTCSLLMLETEADYERFGIRPEQDAVVVNQTAVGALFAKTMAQVHQTLGDPKAAFLAMIAKLEQMPGVRFAPTAAYRQAITQMPQAAFAVPTSPLATRFNQVAFLPKRLLDSLAKHELDYDQISADARARLHQAGAGDALKVLSSLVEQQPGDAVLARDVGFSAMELGLRPQAYHLFRRVAELRPYEPQTYRAMAQVLEDMGNADLALAYYEIALLGRWDPRFGALQAIVELDYLRFLRRASSDGKLTAAGYARDRAHELGTKVRAKSADLVVTITWNTDATDVDLHVTEPSGEECFYRHPRTRSGGQLTDDVTRGYGPEMYVLAKAPQGQYRVRAHYFAADRNRASTRTKVYVRTFENWGTPRERVHDQVVALENGKEWHDIAMIKR